MFCMYQGGVLIEMWQESIFLKNILMIFCIAFVYNILYSALNFLECHE